MVELVNASPPTLQSKDNHYCTMYFWNLPCMFLCLLQQRASGKVVFDLVCTHLNLVEGDYFGLEYQHHKMMVSEEIYTVLKGCFWTGCVSVEALNSYLYAD